MKKILFAICLLLLYTPFVHAETQTVSTMKNEFGGKTVIITFQKGDKNGDTLLKVLAYLDQAEKMKKREVYYTEKFAEKEGYDKTVDIFDKDEIKARTELYYTENSAKTKGFDKTVEYYDKTGKKSKAEHYKKGVLVKTVSL